MLPCINFNVNSDAKKYFSAFVMSSIVCSLVLNVSHATQASRVWK